MGPRRSSYSYHIQEFMIEPIYEEPTGNITIILPIITPKFPATSNCSVPDCESCMLSRSNNRSTRATKVRPLPDKQGALTRYKYEVGYFVSTDTFICKTSSRLPTGYVRYSSDQIFQGSKIYNDVAQCLVWIENQVSLGSNKTVLFMSRF